MDKAEEMIKSHYIRNGSCDYMQKSTNVYHQHIAMTRKRDNRSMYLIVTYVRKKNSIRIKEDQGDRKLSNLDSHSSKHVTGAYAKSVKELFSGKTP